MSDDKSIGENKVTDEAIAKVLGDEAALIPSFPTKEEDSEYKKLSPLCEDTLDPCE